MESVATTPSRKGAKPKRSGAKFNTNSAQLVTPVTGATLLAYRKALGLSRKKLAKLTGIAERAIENYEYGDTPVPSYIDRLMRYFDRYGPLGDA